MSGNPSREKVQSKSLSFDFIVSCNNISVCKEDHKIIDNISFGVHPGEIVTIVGPNGSGKTTLLKTLLGLIQPDSGSVKLDEKISIGYMPQKLAIERIMPITVRRFLRLSSNSSRLRDYKQVEEMAHYMGISSLLKKQIHDISGGEMQRVMLARALLINPGLLVLDEPTQGLDVQGQEEFYLVLESVRRKYGCGILMVSHDLHVVMAKTDRVICLNKHICCQGHPEDISKHPEYLSLFGKKEVGDRFAIYPHKHDHTH